MRTDSAPLVQRDSGLQPERTALAWRRLAMVFLALALATTRLLWPILDVWTLLPTLAIATSAAFLLVESHRRYLGHLGSMATTPPDGRLPFFAAAIGTVTALLFLVVFISGR